MKDVFSMQDEVARLVASKLRLNLRRQTQSTLLPRSINAEAFDHYLRAKFHTGLQNESETEAAIALLEQAVRIDPNFAPAYAELAHEYRNLYTAFKPEEKELGEKAFAAVQRALLIDPNLAEAYVARGLLLWTRSNGFPHERAVHEFRRAIELNPNSDEAHHELANIYNHIGLLDKAQDEIQKAVDINPANAGARFRVAVNLLYQSKYKEAVAAFGDSMKFNPLLWANATSSALFQLGRKDEAAARVAEFLKSNPRDEGGILTAMQSMLAASAGQPAAAEEKIQKAARIGKEFGHFHHTAYVIASAYALMNKPEPAVKWLQAAVEGGFPCYPLFERDPNLNNLRQDPRFVALMSAVKDQWEHYQAAL
jgi:tetratricopeptide (TPR) repeat protein